MINAVSIGKNEKKSFWGSAKYRTIHNINTYGNLDIDPKVLKSNLYAL